VSYTLGNVFTNQYSLTLNSLQSFLEALFATSQIAFLRFIQTLAWVAECLHWHPFLQLFHSQRVIRESLIPELFMHQHCGLFQILECFLQRITFTPKCGLIGIVFAWTCHAFYKEDNLDSNNRVLSTVLWLYKSRWAPEKRHSLYLNNKIVEIILHRRNTEFKKTRVSHIRGIK
jgi:hypothetical protein